MKYPNKDIAEGDWKNDHLHGRGKLIYSDGSEFEGYFSAGIIQGNGK